MPEKPKYLLETLVVAPPTGHCMVLPSLRLAEWKHWSYIDRCPGMKLPLASLGQRIVRHSSRFKSVAEWQHWSYIDDHLVEPICLKTKFLNDKSLWSCIFKTMINFKIIKIHHHVISKVYRSSSQAPVPACANSRDTHSWAFQSYPWAPAAESIGTLLWKRLRRA